MSVWNRSHPVLSPLQQHLTPNGGIAVVEYASTIIALRNLFALFFQTPSNAYLYGRFCEWKLKILFGLLSDVLRLTCSPDIRVPTQYAFIVSCISSSVSKAYLAPEIKTSMLNGEQSKSSCVIRMFYSFHNKMLLNFDVEFCWNRCLDLDNSVKFL